MELDVLINLLLSLGPWGVFTAAAIWILRSLAPRVIDSYRNIKAAERKAIDESLENYRMQSEKVIEIATSAVYTVDKATTAIGNSTEVHAAVVAALKSLEAALKNLNNDFRAHDKRAEAINNDVGKILENTRRAKP